MLQIAITVALTWNTLLAVAAFAAVPLAQTAQIADVAAKPAIRLLSVGNVALSPEPLRCCRMIAPAAPNQNPTMISAG